ncbi:MAG: formylglycine-generating enzyme family protein [Treponema sp.]|nr:formylglycine-generating enzyme family protein [Treponema sp.]
MKIFARKLSVSILSAFLLFLASCNFSNDLPAINPLPVITDLPVKLTASFDIDSSTPKSLQNIILQAAENTDGSRSATASMPSNIQYFVTAETLGEAVPLTVNVPDDDIDEANKRFTINLRTGHNWRITVGIIDNDIDKIILSDYTDKDLTATNTDISHNFTLKPAITSGKNGSVYLEIKLADSGYAIDITDTDNAYTDWNSNLTTSGTTRTLDIASIPSGRYVLKIKFTKANTIPFTATQTVTVYDNLKTNTWVSGGNALIDPTTNEFKLSNTIIAAANEGKKIYYVDGNTGGAGNDNNSGNINTPLQTVKRAVGLINAVGNTTDTYKIYVKAGTSETNGTPIEIGSESGTDLRKIEIETYQTTPGDKLGAVTLSHNVPLSILNIKNGSSLTISGGLTIDGAERNSYGVYINPGATFTMNNGIIQNCHDAGVCNNGTMNLYGGSIINNQAGTSEHAGGITGNGSALNIKGTVNVYNNYLSDATTPANIYLQSFQIINIVGEISPGDSKLGITTATIPDLTSSVQITTGYRTCNYVTPGTIFKGDLYGIKEISNEAYSAASGGALTGKYRDNVEIKIENPSTTVWTGTSASATISVTKNGTAITSPALTLESFKSYGSSYNTDTYRTFEGNTITLKDSLVQGTYIATVSTVIDGIKYTGSKTFYVVPKEVVVASGSFNASANLGDSELFIQNRTTLSSIRGMIVSTHETTQSEYETYCKYGNTGPSETDGLGPDYPVSHVTWYDAIIYCNLKSDAEGLTCAYYLADEDGNEIANGRDISAWKTKYPTLIGSVVEGSKTKYYFIPTTTWCEELDYKGSTDSDGGIRFDENANGWRLPTDAEWEYLARGGNLSSAGYTYSGSNDIDEVAWWGGNYTSNLKNHPVCLKKPNALGIYDMTGNVMEWCWDWINWHTDITSSTPAIGSDWVSGAGRVRRPAYYYSTEAQSTVSSRDGFGPYQQGNATGFRVVRNAQ